MSKKIIKGICLVASLLLFTMSMDAATVNGVGKSEKNVWQDSDSSKENYFNNRRALVGPGCVINSLFDGVEVVSGTRDLQNICNDDMVRRWCLQITPMHPSTLPTPRCSMLPTLAMATTSWVT